MACRGFSTIPATIRAAEATPGESWAPAESRAAGLLASVIDPLVAGDVSRAVSLAALGFLERRPWPSRGREAEAVPIGGSRA